MSYILFADTDTLDVAVSEAGNHLIDHGIVGETVVSVFKVCQTYLREREVKVVAYDYETRGGIGNIVRLARGGEHIVSHPRIAVCVSDIVVVQVIAVGRFQQHYPRVEVSPTLGAVAGILLVGEQELPEHAVRIGSDIAGAVLEQTVPSGVLVLNLVIISAVWN